MQLSKNRYSIASIIETQQIINSPALFLLPSVRLLAAIIATERVTSHPFRERRWRTRRMTCECRGRCRTSSLRLVVIQRRQRFRKRLCPAALIDSTRRARGPRGKLWFSSGSHVGLNYHALQTVQQMFLTARAICSGWIEWEQFRNTSSLLCSAALS